MSDQEPIKDIATKVREYLKDNDELLITHKLMSRLVITFPQKKKLPKTSRLALWIVAKLGGVVDIQFQDKQ